MEPVLPLHLTMCVWLRMTLLPLRILRTLLHSNHKSFRHSVNIPGLEEVGWGIGHGFGLFVWLKLLHRLWFFFTVLK